LKVERKDQEFNAEVAECIEDAEKRKAQRHSWQLTVNRRKERPNTEDAEAGAQRLQRRARKEADPSLRSG
jgi:hypothetical protein